MKKYCFFLFLLFLFNPESNCFSQSMSFRYYQVFKDDSDFDTTVLWSKAKLKKTFENRGLITYYDRNKSLKIKLKDTDFEESYFIFSTSKDYLLFINGWRYFKFNDPVYGNSVAIYQWPKRTWVIYREKTAPKIAKAPEIPKAVIKAIQQTKN